MKSYELICKYSLYLLLLVVAIMLILDIQDGTLDLPVIISHNLANCLNYVNNFKLASHICDVIFLNTLIGVFNTYLFNFSLALLFAIVILFLNKWAKAPPLLKPLSKNRQNSLSKLTFSQYNLTTIKASIPLP